MQRVDWVIRDMQSDRRSFARGVINVRGVRDVKGGSLDYLIGCFMDLSQYCRGVRYEYARERGQASQSVTNSAKRFDSTVWYYTVPR